MFALLLMTVIPCAVGKPNTRASIPAAEMARITKAETAPNTMSRYQSLAVHQAEKQYLTDCDLAKLDAALTAAGL